MRGYESSPPWAQKRPEDAVRAGRLPGVPRSRGSGKICAESKRPGRQPGATASGTFRARHCRGQPSGPGVERALLGTKSLRTPPPNVVPTSFPLCRWCAANSGGLKLHLARASEPRRPGTSFL
ncbi:hypothetical protein NDU88_005843 [Pleurodeles waltl]|uniref:Uncharacterized protein n=1 Tax=Pleurodeles waltl TaxID=8319 RepID=A0AAV7WBP6_PLEWA|nr:hypothetical protein NDU88_005843 [Pleurodeles waltl]